MMNILASPSPAGMGIRRRARTGGHMGDAMETVKKQSVMVNLEKEWVDFVQQVGKLSPDEKEAYLKRQGYPNVSTLLAHIFGWWAEAERNITMLKQNPAYQSPNISVEEFNAAVIEKNRNRPEEDVLREWEEVRRRLTVLVGSLNDAQINLEEMQKELYWDITNHYRDHSI
jgi:hypothetical protein